MKLIPSSHLLVWLAAATAFCAFLSVSATILQSQIALEAPFFSLQWCGWVLFANGLGIAAGWTVFGFFAAPLASLIYCLGVHESGMHWFPRAIVGARLLVGSSAENALGFQDSR